MQLSLNCLVLGQTSDVIFTKYIGEESKIDDVQVKFDQLTVAGFKKLLLREEQLKGITNMDLLKVELKLDSLENKTYTKDEISTIGTKMVPGRPLEWNSLTMRASRLASSIDSPKRRKYSDG